MLHRTDAPTWQLEEVVSPLHDRPVMVIAAHDIPYVDNANRFQCVSLYLRRTADTVRLVDTVAGALPTSGTQPGLPSYYVHIHGGAWRDPYLTSRSIEPTVALAFGEDHDPSTPVHAIASIDYTISQFPTHPTFPYDAIKDNHTDRAREAIHPQHVSDALRALDLLRSFGLADDNYILSGHSCGACLAFQALLRPPSHYGLGYLPDPPRPAALLGLNGLYDLPRLVTEEGLGDSHRHLRDDYDTFLSNAFGAGHDTWPAAAPARADPLDIAERVAEGRTPDLVVLDQSTEDQLVPMDQRGSMRTTLSRVAGLRVVDGRRCTGQHAAPWQRGDMVWQSVQDVYDLLRGTQ